MGAARGRTDGWTDVSGGLRSLPLWDARGVGCHGGGVFPLRGRGPDAAGWEGNTRGDKFGVLERGVEQDLITRGTGAAPFVAGILPVRRQDELAPIPWTPDLCRERTIAQVGFGLVRGLVAVV